MQRDATQQPAGMNKEEGWRMDACGGCTTKGDARQRNRRCDNQGTRGKQEERGQRTRGDGVSIGQGCALRGRGRVERMRGVGINATTSHQTRDYHGSGKSNGNGDGDGECHAPLSRDFAAIARVLAAEAAAGLIVDNANGSNSGVAIIGSAALTAGGGVIN